MFRVLVVDDNPEILDWLYLDLQLNGYAVDYTTNGQQCIQKAITNHYDIIIMDVMMPGIDGYTACKELRLNTKTQEIPVILLTAKGALEDKVKGFDCGADDYLVKPFEIEELLVRMRALLRRTKTNDIKAKQETLSIGDIQILPDSLEAMIKDKKVKLTPTEFEILYCLMQHVNQAVTLPVLLREVWGYSEDEDVRMLRVHVGGLRNKVEINPKKPVYIQTITNVGYKLVPWIEQASVRV